MKYIRNTLVTIMSLVTALSICSCKKEACLEDYVTNADTVYNEISYSFELDYVSTSQFEDHEPSYDLYESNVSPELASTDTGVYEITLVYRGDEKEVQIEVNCEDRVAQSIDMHDPIHGDSHEEIFEFLPAQTDYVILEDTMVYLDPWLEREESVSAGTIITIQSTNNTYAQCTNGWTVSLDDIEPVDNNG